MKRIFTIVVLIASLVFTSCEDFLTEDVRGQLNVDTYYTVSYTHLTLPTT